MGKGKRGLMGFVVDFLESGVGGILLSFTNQMISCFMWAIAQ